MAAQSAAIILAQREGYCRFPFGSLGRASGYALARTRRGFFIPSIKVGGTPIVFRLL